MGEHIWHLAEVDGWVKQVKVGLCKSNKWFNVSETKVF